MCGIAGIMYADNGRPVDPVRLQTMGDAIAHRGPDAAGYWVEPGIGLIHRRLSIIDLVTGDQPIGNEDNQIQVILNGEIYNYRELKVELEARGHRFRTQSDVEVVVHLYEDLGDRLVERLRGMFALAVWDRRRRRLLLARDRVGIKPLYFYQDNEKFLFGSELKAILANPNVERTINVAALDEYLAYGMVSGGNSIIQRVQKLPPGHVLVVDPGQWNQSPRRYWQLRIEPDDGRTFDDWKEAVCAKLQEAVRMHLVADVPVGAFLSGGLDSRAVVSAAAAEMTQPLQTFTIGFRDGVFSELPYARHVAEQFKTTHTEEVVTPDAIALVDELTRYYDEPFADSSAIPTYLVSRLASRKVKVVLTGDGGDEAFGGYSRYAHDLKEDAVRRLLPRWVRQGVFGPLGRILPKADWLPRQLRLKTLVTNLSLNADAAYANTLTLCRQPLRRRLLTPEVASMLNGQDPCRVISEQRAAAAPSDLLCRMIAADMGTLLPDGFLVKVDRASMAHGLEVRPPLLDHELLELTARVPSRWKIHKGQTKWLLKEICRDKLSAKVVNRPKQGFEIPIDSWFRGRHREVFEERVLSPRARVREMINQKTARNVFRAHLAGIGRHGNLLWGLLMLACWAEQYLGPVAESRRGGLALAQAANGHRDQQASSGAKFVDLATKQ